MTKTIITLLAFVFLTKIASAQLTAKPTCGLFTIDILNGTLNNLKPNVNEHEFLEQLPCYTSNQKSDSICGRTLFYKDRDVTIYLQRKYIEVGPAFKGKLSIPLMGAPRDGLFKWLGNSKIKDVDWDAFQTQYGTLVLHYQKNKVTLIQISTQSTEQLSLCQ
ncbi:MAG TPA: hypothetical protein VHZ50_03255 [Puia sp.]|jgi:hypothetical protein|nr:hypothetical protein [Puia sp.]